MWRSVMFAGMLLVGAGPALGDPPGSSTASTGSAAIPEQEMNRPIDLSVGVRAPQFSPATEEAVPSMPRDPEGGGLSDAPIRPTGLARPGVPGIASKHEHIATFQLHGISLFGGNIAGSVDGRSAHLMLSWPTSP
jgi:hypothetical protein